MSSLNLFSYAEEEESAASESPQRTFLHSLRNRRH